MKIPQLFFLAFNNKRWLAQKKPASAAPRLETSKKVEEVHGNHIVMCLKKTRLRVTHQRAGASLSHVRSTSPRLGVSSCPSVSSRWTAACRAWHRVCARCCSLSGGRGRVFLTPASVRVCVTSSRSAREPIPWRVTPLCVCSLLLWVSLCGLNQKKRENSPNAGIIKHGGSGWCACEVQLKLYRQIMVMTSWSQSK